MQKLDDVDRKILDILIDNTRTPFTDIAKRLLISPGTVHVRVKKMEDLGIIKGSSLTLDYKMLGYNFIAYVGILIAHITTGKYNIFCKIRAKGTEHAREIIFSIDDVEGVLRTETMISLEESINDKKRLMKNIFQEL